MSLQSACAVQPKLEEAYKWLENRENVYDKEVEFCDISDLLSDSEDFSNRVNYIENVAELCHRAGLITMDERFEVEREAVKYLDKELPERMMLKFNANCECRRKPVVPTPIITIVR